MCVHISLTIAHFDLVRVFKPKEADEIPVVFYGMVNLLMSPWSELVFTALDVR